MSSRGRPKLPKSDLKSDVYTKQIALRVTPEQYGAVKAIAALHENSMAGYLRHIINDEMRKHDISTRSIAVHPESSDS